jgi:hypothetical protein
MNPNGDIVQRRAEACRDPVAGFAKDVGAPDDFRIVRLERWQQVVEAGADSPIGFDVRLNRKALDIDLFHANLSPASSNGASLMVDDRGCQNLTKPSPYCADVAKV